MSDWPLEETSFDNTQQSQKTDIHAPGRIRNPNPNKWAAADPRRRPRGRWDLLFLVNSPQGFLEYKKTHSTTLLYFKYVGPIKITDILELGTGKGKGKGFPTTCNGDTEGVWSIAIARWEMVAHATARPLSPKERTSVPILWECGWLQGQSESLWRGENLFPSQRFEPRFVKTVTNRYTD